MAEPLPLEQEHELLSSDGSALYVPGFLDPDAADTLFMDLRDHVEWESTELVMFGRRVPEPRQSSWHADDDITYTYSGVTRRPQPWPDSLLQLRHACQQHTGSLFNSALLNHYRNGDDHLGWHSDNELCNGPEPVIASISLGATRRFDMRHVESKETVSVELTHGSLLVMSGLSQQKWVHRVARTTKVGAARINITFRFVDPTLEVRR